MSLEGMQLDHYKLQQHIGHSSIGEVYLAQDLSNNQLCTLKVIRTEASIAGTNDFKEATRLLRQDFGNIRAMQHPHILPVFHGGQQDVSGATMTYIVTQYISEGSVADWLKKRKGEPFSLHEVAHIVDQVAQALQAMHDKQIVHQDVKPSNLIIRKNKAHPNHPDICVTDFWVIKFVTSSTSHSQAIYSLPAYTAPEQWHRQALAATDQYALAVVAYQLLTAQLPFHGDVSEVRHAHLSTQPLPPRVHNPQLPPAINEVLLRALAKNPADRYPSISDFAQAFRYVAASHPEDGLTLSRPGASLLLYCILTGILGIFVGVILNAFKMLPDVITSLSSGIGALLALLSGVLGAVIEKSIPKGIWQRAHWPFAVLASILTVALLTLIAVNLFIQSSYHLSVAATATAQVKATFVAQGHALATLQAQSSVTAQASSATATATAASATATAAIGATVTDQQDPYSPFNGLLSLDDSLVDVNHGPNWYQGRTVGDCKFGNGAYHATVQGIPGFLQGCTQATTDFTNFTYEIQVQIVQGDSGGMLFRANFQKSQAYEFIVDTNGCYQFLAILDPSNSKSLTHGCNKEAISSGPNNSNLMAVVAMSNTFQLYINRQFLTTVKDATFTHGSIGVCAITLGTPTDAAFNYAKVWKNF